MILYYFALLIMLTAGVLNWLLGGLALARNIHKRANRWFFLLALLSGSIGFLNFILRTTGYEWILPIIWGVGILLTFTGIIWVSIFIEGSTVNERKITIYKIVALISFLITLSPGFLTSTVRESPIVFHSDTGPLFYIFLVLQLFSFIVLINKINKYYSKSLGAKKQQLRYTLIGIVGYGVVAITFGVIFPSISFSNLAFLDSPSSLIWVSFTFYAIVRHQLLDIRLVITRSLLFGLLVSAIALLFISVLFLSAQFFNNSSVSRNIFAFVVSAIIVFVLDPLKRFLSLATDRIFFKATINYQAVLRTLSETLSFELDLDKLLYKLEHTMRVELKTKHAAILIRKLENSKTTRFDARPDLLRNNPDLSIRNDSPLIDFLREHRHYSLVESLERKIEDTPETLRTPLLESKAELERIGASMVVPVFAQDHLIAVLTLGPKLSGDSFSNDDVQLLEVISPQIGSAIQKANLYDEVRRFSEGLKIRVDEATSELKERNVSLLTMQRITKEITRTLDFNKVVQQIADSVANELGYIGAILIFLDDDGTTVRARAITQTPLTQKAMALLPMKFTDYSTDIRDPKSASIGHQVLRSGQTMMTASFAQVISPPLPRLLATTIQKLVGMKAMVVVPVNSEGKTIGVIEIGVQKPQEEITKQELETMHALADQLGVVFRNLRFFDQVKQANAQLETANKHLQQLDQAKSEFVSIASHQLRTPMTGIMGYLSMMTSGDFGKIAPEHMKILKDLLAESQRMIRLINQFLNVSKIEAGKFTYTRQPVQLEGLIERQVKELRKAAEDKGLKLSFQQPTSPLPKIMADADKLEDVILNLIDNAIKYTAEGSITVGVEQDGDHVHYFAKDTGIGIKPEDATELFSKFVRGTGIAQIHPDGSGLGLFIAKSIIDAHGGRIWAESKGEGKGSTFHFSIPINLPPDVDAKPLVTAAKTTA